MPYEPILNTFKISGHDGRWNVHSDRTQSSRVYSPSQTTAPPATQTNLCQFFNSDKWDWYFPENCFPLVLSVCYLLWSVSERFGESTAGWKALYTAVLLSFSILQPLQWLRWSKCENVTLCLCDTGSVRSSLCYQLRQELLMLQWYATFGSQYDCLLLHSAQCQSVTTGTLDLK